MVWLGVTQSYDQNIFIYIFIFQRFIQTQTSAPVLALGCFRVACYTSNLAIHGNIFSLHYLVFSRFRWLLTTGENSYLHSCLVFTIANRFVYYGKFSTVNNFENSYLHSCLMFTIANRFVYCRKFSTVNNFIT